jgi:hypothetical protein
MSYPTIILRQKSNIAFQFLLKKVPWTNHAQFHRLSKKIYQYDWLIRKVVGRRHPAFEIPSDLQALFSRENADLCKLISKFGLSLDDGNFISTEFQESKGQLKI